MKIKPGNDLADELPPTAVLWLAATTDRANNDGVIRNLRKCLSFCTFSSIDYLTDVVVALASAIVATWPQPPTNFKPHCVGDTCMATPSNCLDNAYLHALGSLILSRDDAFMTHVQRFVHGCKMIEFTKFTFETVSPAPVVDPRVFERFTSVFGPTGYTTECRYKGHGDFLIYALLRVLHVAPWRASTLLHNETPFGIVARAHGRNANAVVQQYLSKQPKKLMQDTEKPVVLFIIMASILMELAPSPFTKLCVNTDILHVSTNTPRLFVTCEAPGSNGVPRFGYVHDTSARFLENPSTAIIEYVKKAYTSGVSELEDIYCALFTPKRLSGHSPLQQYI
jgi:hypothetical protein